MSDFSAIAGTAESIRRYIQTGMDAKFTDTVQVTLDSPKRIQEENRLDNRLLSLYFYKVTENADLKNSYPVVTNGSSEYRALALDLSFIATPFGPDQDSILRIAGRTQQLLNNMVLSGSLLVSTLEGTDHSIKITQQPYTQELITQMWQAMEISMRMAFYYIATPVYIETDLYTTSRPVEEGYFGNPGDINP